jgi:hypothetical protein
VGAIIYVISITIFAIEQGSSYYLTWIVFGHIVGIYSPISSVIIAGFMLHILVATIIGIISGLFLYNPCYEGALGYFIIIAKES